MDPNLSFTCSSKSPSRSKSEAARVHEQATKVAGYCTVYIEYRRPRSCTRNGVVPSAVHTFTGPLSAHCFLVRLHAVELCARNGIYKADCFPDAYLDMLCQALSAQHCQHTSRAHSILSSSRKPRALLGKRCGARVGEPGGASRPRVSAMPFFLSTLQELAN
jgi:hypothetical protein